MSSARQPLTCVEGLVLVNLMIRDHELEQTVTNFKKERGLIIKTLIHASWGQNTGQAFYDAICTNCNQNVVSVLPKIALNGPSAVT